MHGGNLKFMGEMLKKKKQKTENWVNRASYEGERKMWMSVNTRDALSDINITQRDTAVMHITRISIVHGSDVF